MSTSLLAALAVVTSAGAQVVRGTVVDRGGVPVPGVVVRLIGADSATVTSALTNERGAFSVRSLRAGTFTLQTLRIGFRPVVSDPFTLAAGEAIERRVELTGVAVALGEVRVAGRSSCGRDVRSQKATFDLLEQVRGAITATELAGASGSIITSGVSWRRQFDSTGRRMLNQQGIVVEGSGAEPWSPLPIEVLRRDGYVVEVGDSLSYRAPGLATLASDEFVIDHCFRVVQGRDTSRIAIEFEPTRERRVSEMRGTIWVDRTSFELQRIEYRYVNIETPLMDAGAGGDVGFVRTGSGAWVVSGWSISMPEVIVAAASRRTGRAGADRQFSIASITRTGGNLSFVLRAGSTTDTLWARTPITVTGTILDSISGAPLAGAQVTLREVGKSAITPPGGVFRIEGLFPGDYTVEVQTTSLDSVNTRVAMPLAVLDTGVQVRLRVPSALLIATSICKIELTNRSLPGIVMGSVRRLDADSSAVPNATVIAEWLEGTNGEIRSREVKADGSGNFRFCGVPVGRTVAVRAGTDAGASEVVSAPVPANRRLARAELYIDPALPPAATFTGTVLGDSANPKPLEGVEVSIPGMGISARSNARGEFRLRDIPPGDHEVLVRRLGFGAVDTKLVFAANATVQRRIVLPSVTALTSVNILAERMKDPLLRSFEENRKLGLGKFFTREDLVPFDAGKVDVMLRLLPSARISSGNGTAYLLNGRGLRSMSGGGKCYRLELRVGISDTTACGTCFATVYLDRQVLFDGRDGGIVPNLQRFANDGLEAVEYYPSAASLPAGYSNLNSNCGVLVMHTRRFESIPDTKKKPPRSN